MAHEPHRIAFYLYDLAAEFHALWNRGNDDPERRFLLKIIHNFLGRGWNWRSESRKSSAAAWPDGGRRDRGDALTMSRRRAAAGMDRLPWLADEPRASAARSAGARLRRLGRCARSCSSPALRSGSARGRALRRAAASSAAARFARHDDGACRRRQRSAAQPQAAAGAAAAGRADGPRRSRCADPCAGAARHVRRGRCPAASPKRSQPSDEAEAVANAAEIAARAADAAAAVAGAGDRRRVGPAGPDRHFRLRAPGEEGLVGDRSHESRR